MISGDAPTPPAHNPFRGLRTRGRRCAAPVVHSRFPPDPGRLTSLRRHRQELADPRRLWPVHPARGQPADHCPHPRPSAWIPRLPSPLLCRFWEAELPRCSLPAGGDRPADLPAHRWLRSPALWASGCDAGAMVGGALSLHGKLRGHATHGNALHLLRRPRPLCICRRGRPTILGMDAGAGICLELRRAVAARWRVAGRDILSRAHPLRLELAWLRALAAHRIAVRTDLVTALRRLDIAQLAHLPRLSAARAPFRHRPRRIKSARISTLDKNLDGRLCLHV